MTKEIIATNIDGFLIKHEAFIMPHVLWFDRVISLTGDKSFEQWKGRKDYFKGVDLAMEKLFPDWNDEQRTKQAREWYQQDIIMYVQVHPEVVYQNVKEMLLKLKEKFTLALITTNTYEHINQILKVAGLEGIYDIILCTSASEKPDKASLFQKFVQEYGKPKYYVAARSKEAFEECIGVGINCIYVSWDEFDPEIGQLVDIKAKNIDELSEKLES